MAENSEKLPNGAASSDVATDDQPTTSTGATKKVLACQDVRLPRNRKSWTKLLKACQHLPEKERLDALGEKYNEIFADNREVYQLTESLRKQIKQLQREKDLLETDQSRNILKRERLESVCRELHRQNKEIKDDNLTRLRNEEEKRRLTAAEMSMKLDHITERMEQSSVNTFDLQKENTDMQKRLIEVNDMLNQRGTHLEQMMREVELQKQLSDAIIAKMETERKLEQSVWDDERTRLTSNLEKSEDNCKRLQESLQAYQSKYTEIEGSMQKSNTIFVRFKTDFDKMSKKIVTLEKENTELKTKFFGSMNTVVHLTESNEAQSKHIVKQQNQMSSLENLCRRIQVERTAFLNRLKESNVEVPDVPEEVVQVKSSQAVTNFANFTMKERDLADMKKQLAELQKLSAVPDEAQASTSGTATAAPKGKKNKKTKKTDLD